MKHHRLARLLRILWFIQERRVSWKAARFALEFGISRKTFFKDLRDLQDAGVTIYYSGGRYRCSAPFLTFSDGTTAREALPPYLKRGRKVKT